MKDFFTALLLAAPLWALAHGDAHPAKANAPLSNDRHAWGQQGETVTFEISNGGKLLHEFVIGTEPELVKHAALMKKFPGMEHDAPYMAHVQPDDRQRITWQFTRPGTFLAGCLIAGHWESGMKATIVVKE